MNINFMNIKIQILIPFVQKVSSNLCCTSYKTVVIEQTNYYTRIDDFIP